MDDTTPQNQIPEIGKLAGALAACIGAIERNPAPKGFNSHFKYSFVSISQVTDLVRPLLAEHGVMLLTTVHDARQDGQVTLVTLACTFVHCESGQQWTSHWVGEAKDNQDKGHNKACTAALKQCLLKTFLIADGDEDPDGDVSDPAPPKRSGRPNKTKPSKPQRYNQQKKWRDLHAELEALIDSTTISKATFKEALYSFWGVESMAYVEPGKLSKFLASLKKKDHAEDAEKATELELAMSEFIRKELGEDAEVERSADENEVATEEE